MSGALGAVPRMRSSPELDSRLRDRELEPELLEPEDLERPPDDLRLSAIPAFNHTADARQARHLHARTVAERLNWLKSDQD